MCAWIAMPCRRGVAHLHGTAQRRLSARRSTKLVRRIRGEYVVSARRSTIDGETLVRSSYSGRLEDEELLPVHYLPHGRRRHGHGSPVTSRPSIRVMLDSRCYTP